MEIVKFIAHFQGTLRDHPPVILKVFHCHAPTLILPLNKIQKSNVTIVLAVHTAGSSRDVRCMLGGPGKSDGGKWLSSLYFGGWPL